MATSKYKWFLILSMSTLWSGLSSFKTDKAPSNPSPPFHPFYISVTQIDHNATDKTLEISCKVFTEDLEDVLKKNNNGKVDLSNDKDHDNNAKLIEQYIKNHFSMKVNGRSVSLQFIGFEKEKESVWNYFQVSNVATVNKIEITNSILHDFIESQINIIHVKVNGNRKSTKLDYPNTNAVFEF